MTKSRQTQEQLRAARASNIASAPMWTFTACRRPRSCRSIIFDHMAHGSELYTGYALDGLGQAPNDDEIASVPDLDHIIQLPWEPKVAWMPADNAFQRQALSAEHARRAQERARARRPSSASASTSASNARCSCSSRTATARSSVPNPNDKLVKPCYDVRGFLDNFTWLDKVATCINDLGWDLYSFDHEDANGQFEFDFNYADALTMCDRFIFFRHMAKHYAQGGRPAGDDDAQAVSPTSTGNGAHFNMSLYDLASGRNLFARGAVGGPARPRPDRDRLSLHRRHPAARPGAVRRVRADGQQLQAARPPRRHELPSPGRRCSIPSARTTAPIRCAFRSAAGVANRATPTAGQSLSGRGARARRRARRRAREDRSRRRPTKTTSTRSPKRSGAGAISTSCRRRFRRRSRPLPPIR